MQVDIMGYVGMGCGGGDKRGDMGDGKCRWRVDMVDGG